MSQTYVLDQAGDAARPEGTREVLTEAEFLRLALTQTPLLIRGRLTSWAAIFAEGRGIVTSIVQSPASEVQQALPTLDAETAAEMLTEWPALAQPEARRSPNALAAALTGGKPLGGAEHAAQWLLERINADARRGDLLATLGSALAETVWEEWRPVYLAAPEKLTSLLLSWLNLTQEPQNWPAPFPLTLSGRAEQQVKDALAHSVAAQGLTAFAQWQAGGAPVQVLRWGAGAVAEWLGEHPEQLSSGTLQRLRDFLPPKTAQDLAARLPVALPSLPPSDPAAWSAWVGREYLPFRTSQHADQSQLLPVQRDFAQKFLQAYSAAVNIGTHAEFLVWQRSAALRQSDLLTFVVIADGLSLHDLTTLQSHLAQQDTAQRLSDCGVQVAFPALPTITHQAKPALIHGVAPVLCQAANSVGADFTSEKKIEEALRAGSKGDVVFWNYTETDSLYHKAQSLEQAQAKADAILMFLSSRILNFMLRVIPSDVPAQLVITSDHGRLLLPARRTVTPPTGFRPEGRAAFGEWNSIPATGFEVGEDYALLGRTRFGLNEDAAVMWGDEMFTMANGAAGGEVCPHGGITPEEVLIPWAVYARDLAFRLPTFEVTGRGEAEAAGTLRIRAVNPNALPLSVSAATGTLAGRLTLPLPWTLSPNSVAEFDLPLASWPKKSELSALGLRLSVRAGEAAAQNVSAQVDLESEELYSSTDNILDGLL